LTSSQKLQRQAPSLGDKEAIAWRKQNRKNFISFGGKSDTWLIFLFNSYRVGKNAPTKTMIKVHVPSENTFI